MQRTREETLSSRGFRMYRSYRRQTVVLPPPRSGERSYGAQLSCRSVPIGIETRMESAAQKWRPVEPATCWAVSSAGVAFRGLLAK